MRLLINFFCNFFRIALALAAVSNGSSVRKAASLYMVSNSTLLRHLKTPEIKTKTGPKTALYDDEESEIVKWMTGSIERGAPPGSLDVLEAANVVLKRRLGDDSPTLGKGWLQRFIKRQRISYRVPEKLNKASANITQLNIEGWFNQVSPYIAQRPEFLEAMCDDRRVFNADESMFRLSSSAARVLAPKGTKSLYEVTKDGKYGLTVMATFCANGKACKPFIIFAQERISKSLNESFPHDKAHCAATKSGWMDSTTFSIYLHRFAEEIRQNGIKLLVILFIDNHSSHVSLESSETADKLGIKMIFLYPNSTFLLQPADVAIFRSLKSHWREENRVAKHNDVLITKHNFTTLFLNAFEKISPAVIKTGFFKSGIFPWNSANVDYSKCLGKKKTSKYLSRDCIHL